MYYTFTAHTHTHMNIHTHTTTSFIFSFNSLACSLHTGHYLASYPIILYHKKIIPIHFPIHHLSIPPTYLPTTPTLSQSLPPTCLQLLPLPPSLNPFHLFAYNSSSHSHNPYHAPTCLQPLPHPLIYLLLAGLPLSIPPSYRNPCIFR